MDEQTPPTHPPHRLRRSRRWALPLLACCVLAVAAAWYFRGRTVWTDGRGTRLAVSALTSPRVAGLRAREAVAGWTPAASATSRSVGVCTAGILGFTDLDGTPPAFPGRPRRDAER